MTDAPHVRDLTRAKYLAARAAACRSPSSADAEVARVLAALRTRHPDLAARADAAAATKDSAE